MLSYQNMKTQHFTLKFFPSLSHVIKIVDFVRIYVVCQDIQSGRVFRPFLQLKFYDLNKRYTF